MILKAGKIEDGQLQIEYYDPPKGLFMGANRYSTIGDSNMDPEGRVMSIELLKEIKKRINSFNK